MSGVRILVGTRKGGFILTSDEKRRQWSVDGPLFACNEDVSHDSPDDPLPEAIASGRERMFILGAISGG